MTRGLCSACRLGWWQRWILSPHEVRWPLLDRRIEMKVSRPAMLIGRPALADGSKTADSANHWEFLTSKHRRRRPPRNPRLPSRRTELSWLAAKTQKPSFFVRGPSPQNVFSTGSTSNFSVAHGVAHGHDNGAGSAALSRRAALTISCWIWRR